MSGALLLCAATLAHPLPDMRFDRTVEVRLTAAGVAVRYTLELSAWSMIRDPEGQLTAQELEEIRAAPPSHKMAERLYVKKKNTLIADRLAASANGRPLDFQPEAAAELHPNRDHLEIRLRCFAPWPDGIDRAIPVEFRFRDGNFETVPGKMTLFLKADGGLNVDRLVEPEGLRGVSALDLKPGDVEKLRTASAIFRLPSTPSAKPPAASIVEPVILDVPRNLIEDLRGRGMVALFDSDSGTLILLFAALLFGMAHAFTPGHGKTLVAAYLVGERGTIRHAVALGLSTTLAHTGSVIAMALLLWGFYGEQVPREAQGWLQCIGGLLILFVGLWLMRQRLRGRADHVHLFQETPRESFGWGRVILLGLGGGLVPCWDAVLLLLVAISAGRLAFGIPMLLAFSLGLAAVLVALGVAVVIAHRRGAARFGESRWFRALPLTSAMLLVGMGIWLARAGVQSLTKG